MISKSLSTSEKYARLVEFAPTLAEFCHALYPLVVSHTDDFGRLQGDTFTVKHQCYPASIRSLQEFAAALQAMHDVELIIWYEIQSKRFIQIVQFERHQSGLHKRTRSTFPRVPGTSGNEQENPGQEKGTELKRTKEKGNKDQEHVTPFSRFWEVYPKKVGKDDAQRAWDKKAPDITVVLTALERQRQWLTRENGTYIPNPSTWLNQGRWKDEPPSMNSRSERTCPHDPPCRLMTVHQCQQRTTFGEQRWRELYPQLAERLAS
jgi:hypothetical protein